MNPILHTPGPQALLAAALVCLFAPGAQPNPGSVHAQAVQELTADQRRHELGLRLRALERAYEDAESARRRAALPDAEAAVQAFFAGRLSEAAQRLDAARREASGQAAAAHPAEFWAATPTRRFLEISQEALELSFQPIHPPLEGSTAGAWRLSWRWLAAETDDAQDFRVMPEAHTAAARLEVELPGPPVALPLADAGEGDLLLELGLALEDGPVWTRTLAISRADALADRLEALGRGIEVLPKEAPALEAAAARGLHGLLLDLTEGGTPETVLPAAHLLSEAEALLSAAMNSERRIGPAAPGQHRLWLDRDRARPAAARLFVPPGLSVASGDGAEPAIPAPTVPLVIALHGAGGSENLFFDGHGDGKAVHLAAERGWLLLAPRLGLFGAGAIGEWVDALADRFPIDPERIFLVGHSMGAGAAIGEVTRRPGRYAALAALGGGSTPRDLAPFAALPMLIAPGERDFALGGARALHRAVTASGNEAARLWVVPDSEHLLVVQAALDEVFVFFENVAAR